MKKIKPIEIWSKGILKTASIIELSISGDNLKDTCLFVYCLKENESNYNLTKSSIKISGKDYLDWTGSNDEAYDIVCQKLNLEITN